MTSKIKYTLQVKQGETVVKEFTLRDGDKFGDQEVEMFREQFSLTDRKSWRMSTTDGLRMLSSITEAINILEESKEESKEGDEDG